MQAHALEHQAQRTHRNTTDANQMHMIAGLDMAGDGSRQKIHIKKHPPMYKVANFFIIQQLPGVYNCFC